MILSDSEQCSNRLQFDIISFLVSFSCELFCVEFVVNTRDNNFSDPVFVSSFCLYLT